MNPHTVLIAAAVLALVGGALAAYTRAWPLALVAAAIALIAFACSEKL